MGVTSIRRATVSDAEYISLLGRVTFSETFGALFRDKQDLLLYYERTFSVQKIRNSIANANNAFWIAFVNELPVGYAKLKLKSGSPFINSNEVSQLQKIYVLKDFISLKIGRELQNSVLAKAIENKSEYIWLSVLESNNRAIAFYKKNDFSQVGNHDFQIGKEGFSFIVMSRIL
ncbi:MAG: GNAT family N-acetyltransferase [Maribacter sp.]|uniref:GNAT family N-acetyltransferase n=1 Tax=Maribacter sp. TaxID=1897614 RepID=UPI0032975540